MRKNILILLSLMIFVLPGVSALGSCQVDRPETFPGAIVVGIDDATIVGDWGLLPADDKGRIFDGLWDNLEKNMVKSVRYPLGYNGYYDVYISYHSSYYGLDRKVPYVLKTAEDNLDFIFDQQMAYKTQHDFYMGTHLLDEDSFLELSNDGTSERVFAGVVILVPSEKPSSVIKSPRTVVSSDRFEGYLSRIREDLMGPTDYPDHPLMREALFNEYVARCSYLGGMKDDSRATETNGLFRATGGWPNAWKHTETLRHLRDISKSYEFTYPLYNFEQMQGNPEVEAEVLRGLDWFFKNRLNETTPLEVTEWWHFEMGIPVTASEIFIILDEDLPREDFKRYSEIAYKFAKSPSKHYGERFDADGYNLILDSKNFILRGMLEKNESRIIEAKNAALPVFGIRTTDPSKENGFFEDGSYIFHGSTPYFMGYGEDELRYLSELINVLKDTPYEISESEIGYFDYLMNYTFLNWISNNDLDYPQHLVGRGIGVEHAHNQGQAFGVFELLLDLWPQVGDNEGFEEFAKYFFLNSPRKLKFDDPISAKTAVEIIQDTSVQSKPIESTISRVYPYSDRVLHRTKDFLFSIAMSSSRIDGFENFYEQNKVGWYVGEGSVWLQDKDYLKYNDNHWVTVDHYRLPGTTVDMRPRGPSEDGTTSSKDWVGGVSLDEKYSSVGMEFEIQDSTTTGKKSWFMLDDEIIFLGSGISSSEDYNVETTVENYRLAKGDNRIYVDGFIMPANFDITGKASVITVEGNVPGSRSSYIFLDDQNLDIRKTYGEGSWSDVGPSGAGATFGDNYFVVGYDHGVKPSSASYAYILLPEKTHAEALEYNSSRKVSVLANNNNVQAVYAEDIGVKQYNFWNAGSLAGVSTSGASSVIVKNKNGVINIAVSDPTQKQSYVDVTYSGSVDGLIRRDTNVEILSLNPLNIRVHTEHGNSYQASFATSDICVSDWSCGDWGICSEGIKTRTCVDSNNCELDIGKPLESESCEIPRDLFSEEGYNVLDYGAVPNDGLDDTPSIRAAIEEAGNAGGGVVYIPAGTYEISPQTESEGEALKITKNGISIVGEGRDKTVLSFKVYGNLDPVDNWVTDEDGRFHHRGVGIQILGGRSSETSVRDVTIKNLRLTGNAPPTGDGLWWSPEQMINGWDITHKGINLGGDKYIQNITLSGLEVDNWRGEIVWAGGAANGLVTVEDSKLHATNADCISTSVNIIMTNNELYDCYKDGIENYHMNRKFTGITQNATYIGNIIDCRREYSWGPDGFGGAGGFIWNEHDSSTHSMFNPGKSYLIFENNTVKNCHTGISSSNLVNAVINNNQFINNNKGLDLSCYVGNPYGGLCGNENLSIVNNKFIANVRDIHSGIHDAATSRGVIFANNEYLSENGYMVSVGIDFFGGYRENYFVYDNKGDLKNRVIGWSGSSEDISVRPIYYENQWTPNKQAGPSIADWSYTNGDVFRPFYNIYEIRIDRTARGYQLIFNESFLREKIPEGFEVYVYTLNSFSVSFKADPKLNDFSEDLILDKDNPFTLRKEGGIWRLVDGGTTGYTPVCSNAVKEIGEDCDFGPYNDGSTRSGDKEKYSKFVYPSYPNTKTAYYCSSSCKSSQSSITNSSGYVDDSGSGTDSGSGDNTGDIDFRDYSSGDVNSGLSLDNYNSNLFYAESTNTGWKISGRTSEGLERIWDHNSGTKTLWWQPNGTISLDVKRDFSIDKITLVSANDAPSRDPVLITINVNGVNKESLSISAFASRYESKELSLSSKLDLKTGDKVTIFMKNADGEGYMQLADIRLGLVRSSSSNSGENGDSAPDEPPFVEDTNVCSNAVKEIGEDCDFGPYNDGSTRSGDKEKYSKFVYPSYPNTKTAYYCSSSCKSSQSSITNSSGYVEDKKELSMDINIQDDSEVTSKGLYINVELNVSEDTDRVVYTSKGIYFYTELPLDSSNRFTGTLRIPYFGTNELSFSLMTSPSIKKDYKYTVNVIPQITDETEDYRGTLEDVNKGYTPSSKILEKREFTELKSGSSSKVVEFSYDEKPILRVFRNNTSESKIDLYNVTLESFVVKNKAVVNVRGLKDVETKTVYLELQPGINVSSLCIFDKEIIDPYDLVDSLCDGEDEHYVEGIPSNEFGYNISFFNGSSNIVEISGLRHSAIVQMCTEAWYCDPDEGAWRDYNECGTEKIKPILTCGKVSSSGSSSGSSGSGGGSSKSRVASLVDDVVDVIVEAFSPEDKGSGETWLNPEGESPSNLTGQEDKKISEENKIIIIAGVLIIAITIVIVLIIIIVSVSKRENERNALEGFVIRS